MGHDFDKTEGSRAEVFHGTAKHTSGGLKKGDLLMNKHGRIVSRKKHASAKKEKRLLKHGFGTKKGVFGYVKLGSRSRKRSRKGGSGISQALSPSSVSFSGSNESAGFGYAGQGSDGVQLMAGEGGEGIPQAGGRSHKGGMSFLKAGGRRHRGGSGISQALSPASVSFSGTDESAGFGYAGQGSNGVQFMAGEGGEGIPQAGGRRRGGKSRSRRHKRGRSQRGGIAQKVAPFSHASAPLQSALLA